MSIQAIQKELASLDLAKASSSTVQSTTLAENVGGDQINSPSAPTPNWNKLPDELWPLCVSKLPDHDREALRGVGEFLSAVVTAQISRCTVDNWEQVATAIKKFPTLTHIDLRCTKREGIRQANLPKNTIVRANIHSAQDLIEAAHHLPRLQAIDLSGCKNITGEHLRGMSSFSELKEINLSNCDQLTNECIKKLSSIKTLQHINLSNCRFITAISTSDQWCS